MNKKDDRQKLTDRLKDYVGGQIQVQNPTKKYLYRGEIETIKVESRARNDEDLVVRLRWLAKGIGYPPLPHRWVKDEKLDYAASLSIYSISDIGNGRISLYSPIVNETVVLFPKDGNKLDPAKVEGLELKTT